MTPATAGAGVVAALGWTVWSQGVAFGGFICFAAAAAVLIDGLTAAMWTRGVEVVIRSNSGDAVAGGPFTVTMSVDGGQQRFTVASGSEEWLAEPPVTRTIESVAVARGVIRHLRVDIASGGLTGLFRVSRPQVVPLAWPVLVGPRPLVPPESLLDLRASSGPGTATGATGDIPRGVRHYVPGDPVRHVHWRATARAGQLMVKEVEASRQPAVVVIAELGGGGPAGEGAASRAAWYAVEALRRSYRVLLVTAEQGQPVARPVISSLDVSRRLATADPGPVRVVFPGPDTPPVLLVSDRGDSWR